MELKINKIKIVRKHHQESVVETLVKMILMVNFWVGFVGWYAIYQFLKAKGWLG